MATIREIAAEAGVSVTTASFVLGGKAAANRIAAATVRRVQGVARRRGYRPSYHARAMHTGRADVVALTLPIVDVTRAHSAFWETLAAGVDHAARATGRDLLLLYGDPLDGRGNTHRAMGHLMARRVDALVLPAYADREGWLREDPAYARLPVAVTGTMLDAWHSGVCPAVRLDEEPGLRAAVAHLVALGHRHVLWAGPRPDPHSRYDVAGLRADLFRRCAAEAGLRCRQATLDVEAGTPDATIPVFTEAYRCAMARHLAGPLRETAIMCLNDHVALGVLAALRLAGRRVPADVSVVGFDDLFASVADPPLTVVSHELFEMGRTACELALRLAEGARDDAALRARVTRIPARLVEGASTAPAPKTVSSRKETRR